MCASGGPVCSPRSPDRRLPVAVTCPSAGSGLPDNGSAIFSANTTGLQQFEKWWDKSRTVPFYLVGLLLPLLNFKSPSFFSKFNVLGELRCEGVQGASCAPWKCLGGGRRGAGLPPADPLC